MRDDAGHLTALASLQGVGPSRLRLMLQTWEPAEAWARVRAGTAIREPALAEALGSKAQDLTDAWRSQSAALDPESLAGKASALGLRLLTADDDAFPSVLRSDLEPPMLLWALGDLDAVRSPAVGVVGTRNCTRYGHDVARRTGRELAEAGVPVISGLALGIDAAAHQGSLETTAPGSAAPVGIVGSGLDVVYPSRNRALWQQVAERGVLLSEAPPGAPPERWRFPARNRLIAALSAAVVVVESSERGGSLLTVDEAVARDVEVFAVPGPITVRSSTGTNRLLADGATPYLEVDDVLDQVGRGRSTSPVDRAPDANKAGLAPEEAMLLDALSAGPATLADLAEAVSVPFGQLTLVATQLEAAGRVTRSGGWYEASR
jgi:DNA processing protein